MTAITLTASQAWQVPSDWSANNTIEAYGAGGGGASSNSSMIPGSGGGGGAYAQIINLSLARGSIIPVVVGEGGLSDTNGGDTYITDTNSTTAPNILAKGGSAGQRGYSVAGGLGGLSASSTGTTKLSGGQGGNTSASVLYTVAYSGAGGGAAANSTIAGLVGRAGNTGNILTLTMTSANGALGDGVYVGRAGNGGSILLGPYPTRGGNGSIYGAGGGGAGVTTLYSNTGGSGSNGVIIINYTPAVTSTINVSFTISDNTSYPTRYSNNINYPTYTNYAFGNTGSFILTATVTPNTATGKIEWINDLDGSILQNNFNDITRANTTLGSADATAVYNTFYPLLTTPNPYWIKAQYQGDDYTLAGNSNVLLFGSYLIKATNNYVNVKSPGIWSPKKYKGRYGNTGFYLNFSNFTNANTLGYDYSGSNNNFLPFNSTSNFVTDSTNTYFDVMYDSPTNFKSTGNYATLNPYFGSNSTAVFITDGNLRLEARSLNANWHRNTITLSRLGSTFGSRYYYFEDTLTQVGNNNFAISIGSYLTPPINGTGDQSISNDINLWPYGRSGNFFTGYGLGSNIIGNDSSLYYTSSGGLYCFDGNNEVAPASIATDLGYVVSNNDVIGVLANLFDGNVYYYLNGLVMGQVQVYTNNYTDENVYISFYSRYAPQTSGSMSSIHNLNFGQKPFKYKPSDYKILPINVNNVNTVAYDNSTGYWFDTITYTGSAASNGYFSGMRSPQYSANYDSIWIKNRSSAQSDRWFFRTSNELEGGNAYAFYVNGGWPAGANAGINEPTTLGIYNYGFKSYLRTDTTPTIHNNRINGTGNSMVAWCWNGELSPRKVEYYTGIYGVAGSPATVPHGLGVIPKIIITKTVPLNVLTLSGSLSPNTINMPASSFNANGVFVSFNNITNVTSGNSYIRLNSSEALVSNGQIYELAADASNFYVGPGLNLNDAAGNPVGYISYLFYDIEGYCKIGSYEGNGVVDGPFIDLGFSPKWIMFKNIDRIDNWYIIDKERDSDGINNVFLNKLAGNGLIFANATTVESRTPVLEYFANGFKIVTTLSDVNFNNGTIVYMAFADSPITKGRGV